MSEHIFTKNLSSTHQDTVRGRLHTYSSNLFRIFRRKQNNGKEEEGEKDSTTLILFLLIDKMNFIHTYDQFFIHLSPCVFARAKLTIVYWQMQFNECISPNFVSTSFTLRGAHIKFELFPKCMYFILNLPFVYAATTATKLAHQKFSLYVCQYISFI